MNLYKYITAIVTNKENKEIEQGKLDKLIEKYNKNLHDNLNEEIFKIYEKIIIVKIIQEIILKK